MKLVVKLVSIISCGICAWSTTEIIQNPEIQVTVGNIVGNLGKIIFIIPYLILLTAVLKLIYGWNELTTNKTSFFSVLGIIGMIFCNLFYSSFIKLNDNMRYTEYNNGFIHVTRNRTIEEKQQFLDNFGKNLPIHPDTLKEFKNIDLTECNSYEDILNKLSYNMIPLSETCKPSIFYRLGNNLIDGVVTHPYLTLIIFSVMGICVYLYRDELQSSVIRFGENVIIFIEHQRQIMQNEFAMCESNKALIDVLEYSQAQNGISEKACNELRRTVTYLSGLFVELKNEQMDGRKKLAETIVVIEKIIRANPGLNKDALIEAILNNPTKSPIEIMTEFN